MPILVAAELLETLLSVRAAESPRNDNVLVSHWGHNNIPEVAGSPWVHKVPGVTYSLVAGRLLWATEVLDTRRLLGVYVAAAEAPGPLSISGVLEVLGYLRVPGLLEMDVASAEVLGLLNVPAFVLMVDGTLKVAPCL